MNKPPEEALPGFARLLARSMERKDLSPDDLAYRSELERPRIDRFLGGDAEPSATELLRLAGALGLGPQELIDGIVWSPGEDDGGGFWFEDPDQAH